jgi:hypothetical protein
VLFRSLTATGVAVINVLPVPELTWDQLLVQLAGNATAAQVVHCEDYVNRVLITGQQLPSARATAAAVREPLRRIRSRQQARITVQNLGGRAV